MYSNSEETKSFASFRSSLDVVTYSSTGASVFEIQHNVSVHVRALLPSEVVRVPDRDDRQCHKEGQWHTKSNTGLFYD